MEQPRMTIEAWDRRIGERLRLRELHILSEAVRTGSMARAAAALSITQPAVSQAIALLESTLGVRLLDRGPQGVTPTLYGDVLLRRGGEAYDALAQALRDVAFLAESGTGEVVVGVSESHIAGGLLARTITRLAARYPRISVHVVEAITAGENYQALHDRRLDVMMVRVGATSNDDALQSLVLFEEPMQLVAGGQNDWSHDPAFGFADLAGRPWILTQAGTALHRLVSDSLRAHGLPPPAVAVTTYSMTLRLQLLTTGPYVTAFPLSLVRFNAGRWDVRTLPLSLGRPLSVAIVRLRHREPSPAVRVFVEEAQACASGFLA